MLHIHPFARMFRVNPLNSLSVARLSFPQWNIRNVAAFIPGRTLSVDFGPILVGNAELTGPGTLNRIAYSHNGEPIVRPTVDTVLHNTDNLSADTDPGVFQVSSLCSDTTT